MVDQKLYETGEPFSEGAITVFRRTPPILDPLITKAF
jgi:hypothetical protein